MVGIIPDASRIICAGALKGWKDLLYPTMVSFVLMTLIGVSSAYGLAQELGGETELMVSIRAIAMLLSASFIFKKCHTNVKNDEAILKTYIETPSFFRTGFSLFDQS